MRTLAILLLLAAPTAAQQRRGAPPTGQYHGDIHDAQGKMMRVMMQTPSRMFPQKRISLLLVYHGNNGNEKNYYQGTVDCLQRLKLKEEFVVICGKSKGGGWTIDDDGPISDRVIEWAKKSYPIDPRRVYIWGSSNGAGFIGRYGWSRQDKVAAAVGYCGGYNFKGEKPGNAAETRTEWFFVHGGDDNPGNSRRGCDQLKALGYRYVFRQMDGYGHTDIWDGNGHPNKDLVNAIRDDYVTWIRTLKHKQIAPSSKEQKWLESFGTSKAESLLRRKATYLQLANLGGPLADAAMVKGLQAKSAGTRATAALACGMARFGPKVMDALAALVDDEESRVRFAAIQALGWNAQWNDDPSQAALCRVASAEPEKKGSRSRERVLAVGALGKSIKHSVIGNFEDKDVFWTLVRLLGHEDGRLRATAFAALAPAVKDTFGYHPKLSGKGLDAAVAKWTAWCEKKCGPEPARSAR